MQDYLLMLIHGVTYSRAMSVTEDAAIDRFNKHSAEVSTLYPHHGTHGLALSFSWTNGIPTEPSHCHDTLPATPTNSLLGLSHGWPRAYQRHQRPLSWQKRSQTRTRYHKNKWAHKVMSAYWARVPHAHNLPLLEAPTRGMTMDRIKAFP